ncbi:MAG: LytTR family transcriptional regulator DNA-binding domain-containing protein [Spirochaetota bacterium]
MKRQSSWIYGLGTVALLSLASGFLLSYFAVSSSFTVAFLFAFFDLLFVYAFSYFAGEFALQQTQKPSYHWLFLAIFLGAVLGKILAIFFLQTIFTQVQYTDFIFYIWSFSTILLVLLLSVFLLLRQEERDTHAKTNQRSFPQKFSYTLTSNGAYAEEVSSDEIIYFIRSGRRSKLYSSKGERWIDKSLEEIAQTLVEPTFQKINPNTILNLQHATDLQSNNGSTKVILHVLGLQEFLVTQEFVGIVRKKMQEKDK